MNSQYNRIFKTFGYGILNFLSNFINKYLIFPLIIFYWGNDLFNEWILITNIALQLSLFDFGSKIFLGNKLAKKNFKIEYYYKYLALINLISFICITLCFLSVVSFFDIDGKIENLSRINFNLVLFFSTLIIASNIIIGNYGEVILRPLGLYYKYQKIDFGFNFIISFFLIISLFLNADIVIFTTINFILVFSKYLFLKNYINKKNINVSNIIFNFNFFNKKIFKIVVFNGFFFYLSNVVNLIQTSTLILVGTIGMGVSQIGAFVVHKTFSSISNQFTNILALSFTYEYTKSSVKHDDKKLINYNIKISNYSTILFNFFLIIFAELIFNFWLQNKISFDREIFYILIISSLIRNYGTTMVNFLYAKNKHIKFNSILLILSLIFIPIAYLLSNKYGMLGLAYTYLIYEIIFLLTGFKEIYANFQNIYNAKSFLFELIKIIFFIMCILLNNFYLFLFILLLFFYDIKQFYEKRFL